MSTKDEILQRLRSNTREQYEMPDLSQLTPITFDDPVAEFIRKTTTIAGAKLLEMKADDSLDAVVHRAYPDAKIIASNVPGVEAQLNPDTATIEELEEAIKSLEDTITKRDDTIAVLLAKFETGKTCPASNGHPHIVSIGRLKSFFIR
jgi:hypothetical protein